MSISYWFASIAYRYSETWRYRRVSCHIRLVAPVCETGLFRAAAILLRSCDVYSFQHIHRCRHRPGRTNAVRLQPLSTPSGPGLVASIERLTEAFWVVLRMTTASYSRGAVRASPY